MHNVSSIYALKALCKPIVQFYQCKEMYGTNSSSSHNSWVSLFNPDYNNCIMLPVCQSPDPHVWISLQVMLKKNQIINI